MMSKNQNNKIEDIFEETDRAAVKKPPTQTVKRQAGRPNPVKSIPTLDQAMPQPVQEPVMASSGLLANRRFVIAGVALLVVLCAAGAMAAWRGGLFSRNDTNASVKNTNIAAGQSVNATPTVVNLATVNAGPTDTDSDGLSDAEEKSASTDIQKADTDSDGLFDREEVKVYKTDPLKKDSDGDGKDDGMEVQNGYNPAGPGKLFDLTNSLSNTNQ